MNRHFFNVALAKQCAKAFCETAQVGCVLSDAQGAYLAEFGYSCQSCALCEAIQGEKSICTKAQLYGMSEAERFGGKYIYYCPMGLACFVSPILGEVTSAAKITVGPFLMVERQDFMDCELAVYDALPHERKQAAARALAQIPVIAPAKVEQMSNLLFMAVGFMNTAAQAKLQHEVRRSDEVQGQISSYILQLKQEEAPPYPIALEEALLRNIVKVNQDEAQKCLNKLLGYILFSTGNDFAQVKASIYPLWILMGRAAITAGADTRWVPAQTQSGAKELEDIADIESLCFWLTQRLNALLDSVFAFADMRHANALHRCVQYIETHYQEKITLEQMAKLIYLSPAHFSRVFHKEMGEPFNAYLNRIRIEKSKELLAHDGLRLTDIAFAVGFEDQSYFTKVFKRFVGVTPNFYRDKIHAL